MVAAVPANTIWKNKYAHFRGSSFMPEKKNPVVPNQPFTVSPNMIGKPIVENSRMATMMSATFFIATLMECLARVKPASSSVNPACITNTRMPARRIHARFRES